MSKVQGKNADLLDNLTGAGIASELDSHLRDLEKNIAVAREFIKLADESYSELRHKWNLIQEEARNKSGTGISEKPISSSKKNFHGSTTDEPTETVDSFRSKTDEPAKGATKIKRSPKFTKSEKPKDSNKHEKDQKQTRFSKEEASPTEKLDDVTPPRDHRSKHRGDNARSSTN